MERSGVPSAHNIKFAVEPSGTTASLSALRHWLKEFPVVGIGDVSLKDVRHRGALAGGITSSRDVQNSIPLGHKCPRHSHQHPGFGYPPAVRKGFKGRQGVALS